MSFPTGSAGTGAGSSDTTETTQLLVKTAVQGIQTAIGNVATLVKVSITRPADTASYLAGDVIGSATGSTAALTFANAGVAGRVYRVTGARLEIDVASIPSGMDGFRLHMYDITPPSALGDNTPWDLPSGDRASYLGYVDLGSPVDVGSTLYVQSTGLDYDFLLASANIFGYLVTNGAHTPSSAAVKSITLAFLPL
jgi:hypothetical protein